MSDVLNVVSAVMAVVGDEVNAAAKLTDCRN